MQKNTWLCFSLLVLLISTNSSLAKKINLIPSPIINSILIDKTNPGSTATLNGQGFIANMPEAHLIYLIKDGTRIKASALSASKTNLSFQIPSELEFGDYDISVQIKTRLLKSKSSTSPKQLYLRPRAPTNPKLKFNVISSPNEYQDLIKLRDFQGKELNFELDQDLSIGLNNIRTFYTQNGFESIRSEAMNFYYFPEVNFEKELEINSDSPLKALAITKFGFNENGSRASFDVSTITQKELEDLSKHFYLETPSKARYLEKIIKLNPIFIEQVHAAEEEFAIIANRSNTSYQLNGCTLADDVKIRFSFTKKDNITPKSSLTINQNLGLNNTGTDSLTLSCKDIIIDKFTYEKLDTNGMGIRI